MFLINDKKLNTSDLFEVYWNRGYYFNIIHQLKIILEIRKLYV